MVIYSIEDMFHLIILKDEKLDLKMLRFLFYDTGFFETQTGWVKRNSEVGFPVIRRPLLFEITDL